MVRLTKAQLLVLIENDCEQVLTQLSTVGANSESNKNHIIHDSESNNNHIIHNSESNNNQIIHNSETNNNHIDYNIAGFLIPYNDQITEKNFKNVINGENKLFWPNTYKFTFDANKVTGDLKQMLRSKEIKLADFLLRKLSRVAFNTMRNNQLLFPNKFHYAAAVTAIIHEYPHISFNDADVEAKLKIHLRNQFKYHRQKSCDIRCVVAREIYKNKKTKSK